MFPIHCFIILGYMMMIAIEVIQLVLSFPCVNFINVLYCFLVQTENQPIDCFLMHFEVVLTIILLI